MAQGRPIVDIRPRARSRLLLWSATPNAFQGTQVAHVSARDIDQNGTWTVLKVRTIGRRNRVLAVELEMQVAPTKATKDDPPETGTVTITVTHPAPQTADVPVGYVMDTVP